eukprot:882393-Prymnesium_polylepis.1
MSVMASDDGKFPSPPALSNAEEVAQMMSKSNNRDNPPRTLGVTWLYGLLRALRAWRLAQPRQWPVRAGA